MLQVRGLAKSWPGGTPLFEAVDLDLAAGELVAILGESGAGKSTLLNIVAGLDRAGAGTVTVSGTAITSLGEDELAMWRRRRVGFVFQAFHLLPYLSVEENVGLPLLLNGVAAGERRERAAAALEAVGMAAHARRKPASLSGGEMQRVAVARAVVHKPALVLADEPTGNLDEANAAATMKALRDAVKREGAAGLLVTHSAVAAAAADRVLRLAGRHLGPA
ncbi:MAG TPA: ABC transporter ATP-binding protein [Usitatibacteraceae bacterium]|jgi:putative ABC transport system ATP-binding protein|nr:ABC transporter ATP-binding protein [Usitatibacteraceae bacterium]